MIFTTTMFSISKFNKVTIRITYIGWVFRCGTSGKCSLTALKKILCFNFNIYTNKIGLRSFYEENINLDHDLNDDGRFLLSEGDMDAVQHLLTTLVKNGADDQRILAWSDDRLSSVLHFLWTFYCILIAFFQISLFAFVIVV